MSESSTAPTTPSAELSESSSNSSKSMSSKSLGETCPTEDLRRASQSDSLVDSATEGCDEPCSCNSLQSYAQHSNENEIEGPSPDTCLTNNSISSSVVGKNVNSLIESRISSSDFDSSLPNFLSSECNSKQVSDSSNSTHHSDSQDSVISSKVNDSNKRRSKKCKKSRSLSTESSVSSHNSSSGENKTDSHKASTETVSKYQAKKTAKLLKKDKKKLKKEKNKAKKTDTHVGKILNNKYQSEASANGSQEFLAAETDSQDSTVFIEEESTSNLLRTENVEESSIESIIREKEIDLNESTQPKSLEKELDHSPVDSKTEEKNSDDAENETTQCEENVKDVEEFEPATPEKEDYKMEMNEISQSAETKISENSETKNSEDCQAIVLKNSEAKNGETNDLQNAEKKSDVETETPEEKEEESEKEKTSPEAKEKLGNKPLAGDFIYKQGFVMVPILTPYYDPASE